ncbi:hypothetical protein CCHR01_08267 [Colletotrichum chrysophilum]|uniref:Uncharacterized protein n=1 Tax=Colletotrichum chrysophilum TaxID=1836956 RepID=A0AAD9ELL0_9PEZI|nr:hypothetical protein CCHR01_08267 [Colletotrichum chrysophilum]
MLPYFFTNYNSAFDKMPSMADYHSVSNVETESTPDLEHETTAQQPRDDESDSSSDSESVSVLALQLDQKVRSSSEYGVRLEEITRLGPTIYPILFAMVVARFYRNIARWYLERPGGITVSSLEQIVGSQSFASALERLIVVRARLLLGALILLSWAMSPLGASDVVPALYSASLLSPRKQQQASMDLWGRPKVPQWPLDPTQDAEETWREVDNNALESGRDYYTSLIGVNTQGLNFSNNSTQYEFDLDSNYINFNCSLVVGRASSQDLEKMTFPGGNLSDAFWGRYHTRPDELPSFAPILVQPTDLFINPYLLYISRGDPENLGIFSVFNCTTANIDLRTNLICSSSATDNYIANDENVYADQKAQTWTGIDLNLLAICGLVLKCLIRGPDILGFASSLTRDNAFVPVSGGSFQGGAEHARALRKMRIQLTDVQPGGSRGYIALSAVPSTALAGEGNDGDKEESPKTPAYGLKSHSEFCEVLLVTSISQLGIPDTLMIPTATTDATLTPPGVIPKHNHGHVNEVSMHEKD